MGDIASMLIIIVQCDVKQIMMTQIKTIMSALKALTNIITSIKACLIGLAVILVIISVSIFITAAILSILMKDLLLYLPN
jgi:hypothetical protein